jgi:hypothetical protein
LNCATLSLLLSWRFKTLYGTFIEGASRKECLDDDNGSVDDILIAITADRENSYIIRGPESINSYEVGIIFLAMSANVSKKSAIKFRL